MVNPSPKRSPQPTTINATGLYDMVYTKRARHFDRTIGRAIINNLILNRVDPCDPLRHLLKDKRQGPLFIKTWDLNN
jgi:hypothetical protein